MTNYTDLFDAGSRLPDSCHRVGGELLPFKLVSASFRVTGANCLKDTQRGGLTSDQ